MENVPEAGGARCDVPKTPPDVPESLLHARRSRAIKRGTSASVLRAPSAERAALWRGSERSTAGERFEVGTLHGVGGFLQSFPAVCSTGCSGSGRCMARVIVVSGIRLYRDGLAEVLSQEADISVVGALGHEADNLERLDALRADVVLVDLGAPEGLGFLHAVAQRHPHAKLVALGLPETETHVVACAEAGAAGYVPREATLDDLLRAIRAAEQGEARCSPKVAAGLFRRLARWARSEPGGFLEAGEQPLTRREHQVAGLIEQGLSNKEIAVRLGIELATVKNHVHNLLEKLRVHRRGEAAARLRRRATNMPTGELARRPSVQSSPPHI